MRIKFRSIANSLNKAYLKQDVAESDFNRFKNALEGFFQKFNTNESEEHQKNNIAEFLKIAFYMDSNLINTKGRIDLAIFHGSNYDDDIGVLIEVKSTRNRTEMMSYDKPNSKALHEAISYYLNESISNKNKNIKNIIITNSEEWFVFDGAEFEKLFYKDKYLIEKFTHHKEELFGATSTDWFYTYLRDEIIPKIEEINCTYFNLIKFKDNINNPDFSDSLINLFKLLSPEHLLKKPFANDSNTLDTQFYDELLHLLGLEEVKDGGKKILLRLPENKRNHGSLLENTIKTLIVTNSIEKVNNRNEFGNNEEEQLFSIGLELCITWLNRILFLKLLESQLIKFNNNDYSFKFLTFEKNGDFDELNELFFEVLAVKTNSRAAQDKDRFAKIPYLNSSLFEPTFLEKTTIMISSLKDRYTLPIFDKTVLKTESGSKRIGELKFQEYLFNFLDSYNFANVSKASIQKESKTIINSSVLGLIFEKLNGYKDGSFFTPGFITMYMCRETIRKAVLQKFNEALRTSTPNPFSTLEKGRKEKFSSYSSLHSYEETLDTNIDSSSSLSVYGEGRGEVLNVRDEVLPSSSSLHAYEESPDKVLPSSSPIYQESPDKVLPSSSLSVYGEGRGEVLNVRGEALPSSSLSVYGEGRGEVLNVRGEALPSSSLSVYGEGPGEVLNVRDKVLPTVQRFLPKSLLENARFLRKNQTHAEQLLWELLRNKQLHGLKFRRQHPIVPHIIFDFFCSEARLAIELDGKGHSEKDQQEYDAERAKIADIYGIKIIRFQNQTILDDIENVLNIIYSMSIQRIIPIDNDADDIQVDNFDDLTCLLSSIYKKQDLLWANSIINSLKLCDPAVGSGHYLVSALNEFINIKAELGILIDKNGKKLKDYKVFVENDELIIIDIDDQVFTYFSPEKASGARRDELQRVQETIFHEKRTIIENCLFGVDINPKSVSISRLRLWIELLKFMYYKIDDFGNYQLETLPNIDINIKTGNSLISRFPIDENSPLSIADAKIIPLYKQAVNKYKNVKISENKKKLLLEIDNFKSMFKGLLASKSNKYFKLNDKKVELKSLIKQTDLFAGFKSKKDENEFANKVSKLTLEIQQLENEVEELENNPTFSNAFEWRFEFPEVLDDNGKFVGFDIVIGNPPYIQLQKDGGSLAKLLEIMNYETFANTGDIYSLFYEKGWQVLKPNGLLCFITSNKWMRAGYGEKTRAFLANKTNPIELIDFGGFKVFENATVDTNILLFSKSYNQGKTNACSIDKDFDTEINMSDYFKHKMVDTKFQSSHSWIIMSGIQERIKNKIEAKGTPLKDWDIKIFRGVVTGFNEAFIIDGKKKDELIAQDPKSAEIIKPILKGDMIKKYNIVFRDLYLINSHNGLKKIGLPPINIADDYPAIKNHFDIISDLVDSKLITRKGGHKSNNNSFFNRTDKGVTYYNLRDCAYLSSFESPKIIWKQTSTDNTFTFDNNRYFLDVSGHMLVSTCDDTNILKYILSLLNSNACIYYFKKTSSKFGENGTRWIPTFIEILPIPQISPESQQPFIDLVNTILAKKERNEDTSQEEAQIDLMVYKLYELTYDEVLIIEPDFAMSREEYESQ